VPITIELPAQAEFNLARWDEILADPELARLPHRIETDRLGRIIMSPPPAFTHADRQGRVVTLLNELLSDGRALPECPLSTADGVKAIDVAWLAGSRPELVHRPAVLTNAPEICVEILSPANSVSEIDEKRALYFDAGAREVWICNLDGSFSFFLAPHHLIPSSALCPAFPARIA
jgi:Uma2 family endonuclease